MLQCKGLVTAVLPASREHVQTDHWGSPGTWEILSFPRQTPGWSTGLPTPGLSGALVRRGANRTSERQGTAAARGYWLAQRRRWECQACRKQAGPRTGTVMAGSPLRLSVWFCAIQAVLAREELNGVELARRLHIRRLATVRSLVKKIVAASTSPHRSRLLAGLDCVFSVGPPEAAVPEIGVLTGPFLENKS